MEEQTNAKTIDGSLTSSLVLYVFNVGQGDHLLLELPSGKFGLIDFYYPGDSVIPEPMALTYLKSLKQTDPARDIIISFVCLSHPDLDHTKGVDSFLKWAKKNNVEIENLWLFAGRTIREMLEKFQQVYADVVGTESDYFRIREVRNRWRDVQEFIDDWEGTPQYIQDAKLLGMLEGGALTVVSIAPLATHIRDSDNRTWAKLVRNILDPDNESSEDGNLMSSVLLIKFLDHHRLLFGGDTGKQVWLEALEQFYRCGNEAFFGPATANFVKVSHHGSRNSSSTELWERILGSEIEKYFLAISAGRRIGYDHPHAETLSHILAAATKTNGTAEIVSTNSCSTCLAHSRFPDESIQWPLQEPAQLSYEHGMGFGVSRSKRVKKSNRFLPFGGFIFRFDSMSKEVQVSRAMIPLPGTKTECIYGNSGVLRFPECRDYSLQPPSKPAAFVEVDP